MISFEVVAPKLHIFSLQLTSHSDQCSTLGLNPFGCWLVVGWLLVACLPPQPCSRHLAGATLLPGTVPVGGGRGNGVGGGCGENVGVISRVHQQALLV